MLACGACCKRGSAGVVVPCSDCVVGCVEVPGPKTVSWIIATPGGWNVSSNGGIGTEEREEERKGRGIEVKKWSRDICW